MKNRVFVVLEPEVEKMQLWKKENNLEGRDNLDEIPETMAVFTICGRVNGYPANPRYTATTKNLRESVKLLFNAEDSVGEFMRSIKLKDLLYEPIKEKQFETKEEEWNNVFAPNCSPALNEVY